MNTIRAKIILSWLLFLVWGVVLYLHHALVAWSIYGLLLLVRYSKPKVPQLPQRVGYLLSFGLIAFLVLVLIDGFYPFPASALTAGEILAVLIFCPLLFYAGYLDFKAFRTHDKSA
jgi:hypothetical protein